MIKMERTDYRKLCLEIFGTDDEDELRKIAEQMSKKNTRSAGRKRKFTEQQVSKMRCLREDGVPVRDIARRFGTSRQIVSKYLNTPLPDGYTMRMTYMFQNKACTTIDVNFLQQKIRIRNSTNDVLHRAFGTNEHPTWRDFEIFLQDRCFPPTRGFLKEELQALGLDSYDPLRIVEQTKGRTTEDGLWLKIQYGQ